jgi:hypothetical protein
VLQAVLDRLVGKKIELLLLLALYVLGAYRPQNIDQAGPADGGRDDLGGQRNVVEQVGQLARRFGIAVFLIQDEAFNRGDGCLQTASLG